MAAGEAQRAWHAHSRLWLWLSLGLHAIAVLYLGVAGWRAGADGHAPALSHYQQLVATRDRQDDLKRRLQTLERIERELGARGAADAKPGDPSASTGPSQSPADLEQRLQQVAEEIRLQVLPERATELARMLNVPEHEAREMLQAEARTEAAQGLDALQQQAQDALDFRRRQQRKAQTGDLTLAAGLRVGGGSAGGAGPSGVGQIGSVGPGESLVGDIIDRRGYGALIEPPTLDAAHLHLGSGRTLGASGEFANRVYVDRWYWIGPFAGIGAASRSISFPPEHVIDLDGVYPGKQGRPLRWRYQRFADYPWIPPNSEGGSVYYGYTEIRLDAARAVWMSFGVDDDAKVWVNDELVWVSGDYNKPWYFQHFKLLTDDIAAFNLTEATRRVQLRQGSNRILFKLYNSSSATFFSLVITP